MFIESFKQISEPKAGRGRGNCDSEIVPINTYEVICFKICFQIELKYFFIMFELKSNFPFQSLKCMHGVWIFYQQFWQPTNQSITKTRKRK